MLIGEDVSERLDVMPAKFRVIVTRRPKYAFKNEDSVMSALEATGAAFGHTPLETDKLIAYLAPWNWATNLE